MKVSVVIPVYNYAHGIERCLKTVTEQDYDDYEVIIVNDGSTDHTADIVAQYPVRLINKEQGGAASARNLGAEKAEGEIIIFLDADCQVLPDWITQMVKPFSEPEVGATHGLYDIANPGNLVAELIYQKCRYIFSRLGDTMDFAWTFSVAVRKQVFFDIGKFDVQFPGAGSEDIDMAYRVIDAGYQIKLVREALVKHMFLDSLKKHLRRHLIQAKLRMQLINKTIRFTDQQVSYWEYLKFFSHGASMAGVVLLPWLPSIPVALFFLSLALHWRITYWVVKDTGEPKYLVFLPFEYITICMWVIGAFWGLVWLVLNRDKLPERIKA